MAVDYVEVRLYNAAATDYAILTEYSGLSFDKRYNDFGVVNFSYPQDSADTLGLKDQSLIGVALGFSNGAVREVERYYVETTDTERISDGRRMRSVTGECTLGVLCDDAVVYPSNWPSASPTGHSFTDATLGTIWRTLISRAHGRNAILNLSETSFSGTQDSFGAVWSLQTTQDLSSGQSYKQVLTDLISRGLVDAWMDGWNFRLVNGTTRGAHLSIDALEIRPAKNASDMSTATDSSESCTTVLIEGEEGTALERNSADALALLGRRRERYVSQSGVADAGILAILGDAELTTYGRIPAEETVGIGNFDNAEIFFDFDVADWIWVRYRGQDAALERRVHQIAVSVDENGSTTIGLTLNSILYDSDVKLARKVEAYAGGGSVYGATPSTDNTVPNAPVGTTVASDYYIDGSGQYQGAFVAAWGAPTTNVDGSPLSDLHHYELRWRYLGTTTWNFVIRTGGTETSIGYSPVTPGRTIEIQVRAVDATAHYSAWSGTVTATLAIDTTPPPIPSTPNATDGPERVDVAWDGLAFDGSGMGNDFLRVEIWQSPTNGFTPGVGDAVLVGSLAGSGTYSAPGLAYDQTVYYKFVAVDQAGNRSAGSTGDGAAKRHVVTDDPGTAPTVSPDVELIGGIGVLHARWKAVLTSTGVRYQVHVSTIPDFVPSLTSQVLTTPATAATVKWLHRNMVVDGNFESENLTDNFTTSGTSTLVPVSDQMYAGGQSALFTPSAAGAAWARSSNFTAAPGDNFTVAVRGLANANARSFYTRIEFLDASNTIIQTFNSAQIASSKTVWKTATVSAQGPANTVAARAYLYMPSAVAGESHYFDLLEATSDAYTEPLQYGVDYYCKIRSENNAGAAPAAGAQATARLHQVDSTDISANYIYAGQVTADQIIAGEMSADVTLSGLFKTADTGSRVEIDNRGMRLYDSLGLIDIDFNTNPDVGSSVRGQFDAENLAIQDKLELFGQSNILAMGSRVVMQTRTYGSNSAPKMVCDYETFEPDDLSRPGWACNGFQLSVNDDSVVAAYTSPDGLGGVVANGQFYVWPVIKNSSGVSVSSYQPYGVAQIYVNSKILTAMIGNRTNPSQATVREFRVYDLSTMTSTFMPGPVALLQDPNLGGGMPRIGRVIESPALNTFAAVELLTSGPFRFRRMTVNYTGGVYSIVATSSYTTAANYNLHPGLDYVTGVTYGDAATLGCVGLAAGTSVWFVPYRDWVYCFNTGGTRQPDQEFPLSASYESLCALGPITASTFAGFRSFTVSSTPAVDQPVTKYTSLSWTSTTSDKWWGGVSWYDSNTLGLQILDLKGATGGTFTLTFRGQVTGNIAYNASVATIQTALDNLSTVEAAVGGRRGDLVVSMVDANQTSASPMYLNWAGQYGSGYGIALATINSSLTGTTGTPSIAAAPYPDGGTHETNLSSLSTVTMKKRARLSMTAPSFPAPAAGRGLPREHNDVNRVRIYLTRSNIIPSASGLFLQNFQPDVMTGGFYYDNTTGHVPNFTGTAPPLSSDFPDSAPAILESSALGTGSVPKIRLTADGFSHFEALDVGGDGSKSFTGKGFDQLYYSIRAQAQVAGGGIKAVNSLGSISWDARFILLSLGRGTNTSPVGEFDITMPPNGTVIPGHGGAASQTVGSGRIPLPIWNSLWYDLPWGKTSPSVEPGNFHLTSYTGAFTVPNSWILLAFHNADGVDHIEFATGENVEPGFDSLTPTKKYWTDNAPVAYTHNSTSAHTIGANVNVAVRGLGDVFQVQGIFDCVAATVPHSIFTGEIYVDSSLSGGGRQAIFKSDTANTRMTISQNWTISGLAAGTHNFALFGSLVGSTGAVTTNTHSTINVTRV